MVRFKNRYILCELVSEDGSPHSHQWNDHEIYGAVRGALTTAHGDYGIAAVKKSLNVKYMNKSTGVVVIRTRRGFHQLVSTSLPFIKAIRNKQVSFRTLHLSGTIRSCQKYLIKHHRRQLVALMGKCTDPDLRQKIQDSLQNCEDICVEDAEDEDEEDGSVSD